jgi:hypothetical protein
MVETWNGLNKTHQILASGADDVDRISAYKNKKECRTQSSIKLFSSCLISHLVSSHTSSNRSEITQLLCLQSLFVPSSRNKIHISSTCLPLFCNGFYSIRDISWGTRYRSWLRHYTTSREVAVSSPDEVDFFSIYLILPVTQWPWGRLKL